MEIMEVTPAEFARLAFVSRQSINGKLKSGTLIINNAGFLDTDNPINRAYLNKHQNQVQKEAQINNIVSTIAPVSVPTPNKSSKIDTSIAEDFVEANQIDATTIQAMTLGEIVRRFGSMEGIDKFVKLQKDLIVIEEKNQRLQEKRLQQLPRDFVIARLFGYQQQQASRILDVPESAVDQIIAFVRSNPDDARQKIIEYLRDLLSRAIGGAKEHVINELNSLKAKYSDDQGESISDKIDALMEARQ